MYLFEKLQHQMKSLNGTEIFKNKILHFMLRGLFLIIFCLSVPTNCDKYEISCINFFRIQPKIQKIILLETREQLNVKPCFRKKNIS